MSATLTPYLTFDGEARAAMTAYQRVLGGELDIATFGQFGMEGPDADKVMHAQLTTPDGLVLMGADAAPGTAHERARGMSVCIAGTDTDTLRGWWDALAEGAQVVTALEKQVWGDEYGMCVDRFGTPWMFNIGQAQD